MKFSEMTYSRPDIQAVKLAFENLVERLVADMSDLNDAGGFSFRKFKNKGVKTDTSSDFSEEDRRIYIKTALLSSMLIAGIFIVAGALFIMFCQHIWLK